MKLVLLAVMFVLAAPAHADGPSPTEARLKLLDTGKDPKTTLQLVAKKGMKKRMTMTMGMAFTNKVNGTPTKIGIPPIEIAMDLKVTDVTATGEITCELVFGKMKLHSDASTPKAMTDAFAKIGSGIAGTKGRIRLARNGRTIETIFDIPSSLSPEAAELLANMRSSLGQVSALLPEEPVGIGAKWETQQKIIDNNGMELDQVTISEVTAIKGKRTTLKQTVTNSAKPGKIKSKGIELDLKSVTGGGNGEMFYEAGTFVPVDGGMDIMTSVKLSNGGQTFETTVEMKLRMKTR
ncbi:MAG: hypothetical protein AB7L94_01675 [Kofleriaceae bacterium]